MTRLIVPKHSNLGRLAGVTISVTLCSEQVKPHVTIKVCAPRGMTLEPEDLQCAVSSERTFAVGEPSG